MTSDQGHSALRDRDRGEFYRVYAAAASRPLTGQEATTPIVLYT